MSVNLSETRRIHQFSVLFVCHAGATLGLGHLTRMLAVAEALKIKGVKNFKFIIFGEKIKRSELEGVDCKFLSENADFSSELLKAINTNPPKVIVLDLHPKFINRNFKNLFTKLSERKIYLVGVDSLFLFANKLDLTWIPSFYKPAAFISYVPSSLKYGWDTYLIQKRLPTPKWSNGNKVLVLTGGSDFSGLGKILPHKLDNQLPQESEIHWVQGPFASAPDLPANPRLKWFVHETLESLDELIVNCNYALSVFGVSFFELLQYGIPTVVFSPYDRKDESELLELGKEKIAIVSKNAETAVKDLFYLMQNEKLAISLSQKAMSKLSVNGALNLANKIVSLLNN